MEVEGGGKACVGGQRCLGKSWGDDRVWQGTPALGQDGFYVDLSSEVKAWQRQEEETEQVEGEDLAIFFPSIPQATSLTTNLSLKPLGCHGNRME